MKIINKLALLSSIIIGVTACNGVGGENEVLQNGFSVSSTSPTDGSFIAPDQKFTIKFSNNVDENSINNIKLINITKNAPEKIHCELLNDDSAECSELGLLAFNSEYRLIVPTSVENKAHNPLIEKDVEFFTHSQPLVTEVTPSQGNIKPQDKNFSFTFSESMDVSTMSSVTNPNNVILTDLNQKSKVPLVCMADNSITMSCVINGSLVEGESYLLEITNTIKSQNEVPIIAQSYNYKVTNYHYVWHIAQVFSDNITQETLDQKLGIVITTENTSTLKLFQLSDGNLKTLAVANDRTSDIFHPFSYYKVMNNSNLVYIEPILENFCWGNSCPPETFHTNIYTINNGTFNLKFTATDEDIGSITDFDNTFLGETINGMVRYDMDGQKLPFTPIKDDSIIISPQNMNALSVSNIFENHDNLSYDGLNTYILEPESLTIQVINNSGRIKDITYNLGSLGITKIKLFGKTFGKVLVANNSIYYFSIVDGWLFKLEGTSWKKILETTPMSGNFEIDVTAMLINNNTIYVGTSNGHLYRYDIGVDVTQTELTTVSMAGTKISGIILYNNMLYVSSNNQLITGATE
ncbi:MAG: Ig-like domain-containing protein [Burkholderiales bacterium]|nr:Ig-like domain-containing protein [Burkholderiales bacterium]